MIVFGNVKYNLEEINGNFVYSYDKITRNPLTPEEAKSCLYYFQAALDKLHRCGFAHNDVRLPNISFRDSYFMRSVKRVADRLKECSAESRRILTTLKKRMKEVNQ